MEKPKEYKQAKDLQISTAIWKLLEQCDLIFMHMDKAHQPVFGRRILDGCLDMLDYVARANRATGTVRVDAIKEVLDKYNYVANCIRYCIEHGYLGDKEHAQKIYVATIPLLANVSRQANGWYNASVNQSNTMPGGGVETAGGSL